MRRAFVRLLHRVAARLTPPPPVRGPHGPHFEAWLRDRGDHTHRLDYALSAESVVWDAGGFEGNWAAEIAARFACRLRIFEPSPVALVGLQRRFRDNPRISIQPIALGAADGELSLHDAGDASSTWGGAAGAGASRVRMRDIAAVFAESGDREVALLKLNIEGGEYEVLERLADANLLTRFRDLQIQFHDFVPDATARREALRGRLGQTHRETWCYPFVWENWRRRD